MGRREERGGGYGRGRDGEGERRSRAPEKFEIIDYRNVGLLRRFLTQHGKIMPSRFTGVSATQQRQIARAIRRARVVGLIP